MIRYKLYQNNNKRSAQYKKWYARAACEETVNTEGLARHMAEHNSPYPAGGTACRRRAFYFILLI